MRCTTIIDSLPEKSRIVFQLRYKQGYFQRQIAEELQVSEKTAESHLAKARKTSSKAIILLGIQATING